MLSYILYLKRSAVKVACVPQFEGLTIKALEKFGRPKADIMKCLPNEADLSHIDKKWLCDVIYTKDQAGIQQLIEKAIKERKDKLEKSRT